MNISRFPTDSKPHENPGEPAEPKTVVFLLAPSTCRGDCPDCKNRKSVQPEEDA